jgi:acetyl-CoA acetyltransferase
MATPPSNLFRGNIAVVGVGYSQLSRDSGQSVGALALRAAKKALNDAGLGPADIDGVGMVFSTEHPTVAPGYVIAGLGIPRVTWNCGSLPPSIMPVIEAAYALHAGACNYALIVHAKYRWDLTSRQAGEDPLRRAPPTTFDLYMTDEYVRAYGGVQGPAALMRRHMHEFGSLREDFGRIAVNNRTNALSNERAVFKSPLTLADYLAGPMVDDPFCIYDMDMPIDGAAAVVLTRAELANGLRHIPVYIEAAIMGANPYNDLSCNYRIERLIEAYSIVGAELWNRTGYTPLDMDLIQLYDGFSVLAMCWLDAVVAAGPGRGKDLLRESWVESEQRFKLWGRVPVCTHGGNLSEGRLQGFGHFTEAVLQLRGECGKRQVTGAQRALVLNGINATCGGVILASG